MRRAYSHRSFLDSIEFVCCVDFSPMENHDEVNPLVVKIMDREFEDISSRLERLSNLINRMVQLLFLILGAEGADLVLPQVEKVVESQSRVQIVRNLSKEGLGHDEKGKHSADSAGVGAAILQPVGE